MLGRAAAVYPCCLIFARSNLRVSAAHQHILFWGGLRGALALALALGLPIEVMRENDYRDKLRRRIVFRLRARSDDDACIALGGRDSVYQ